MSAVLKEEIEEKGLAVIPETQELMPVNFHETIIEEVETAIENIKPIVFENTEEGEAECKAFVKKGKKYSANTGGHRKTWVNDKTSTVKLFDKALIDVLRRFDAAIQEKHTQFEEVQQARLLEITRILDAEILKQRIEKGVSVEFYRKYDISSIVKLTGTFTPGGKFTTKTAGFIATIVNGDLAEQERIKSRHLLLENMCLRAEIYPPLTSIHLGELFFASDIVFKAKVDELVTIEVARKIEMKSRIERDNAAENQRKTDDALKAQQAESDRAAHEKAMAEMAEHKTVVRLPVSPVASPEQLRQSAKQIAESAERAPSNAERNQELGRANNLRKQADEIEASKPKPGTRHIQLTVIFNMAIPDQYDNADIEERTTNQLPENLKKCLFKMESRNV